MSYFKSANVLIACFLLMVYTAFVFYPRWHQSKTEATISWDVSGYYLYLPAIFIYKDIKNCKFKDQILSKYNPTPDFQQAFIHQQSGNYVFKYSSGLSLTMLPFFCIAHIYSLSNTTFPADGFSFPYQICIGIGMFLYSLLGLFFLRKLLLFYFSDFTVSIVLIAIVFGTNYLDYSSVDQAMTHSVLFTLYCLLMVVTYYFYVKPTYAKAIAIGSIIGLSTLIRPTEIIGVLIPMLWNITNWKDILDKIKFLKAHLSKIIVCSIFLISVMFIQLFYWKFVTNQWIVDSYQGSGFYWSRPHVYDYALSYKCGWLRYCPMMFISIVGLLLYVKKGAQVLVIILLSLLSFYIVSAWDVWDYGNSSGRAMVQYYPILAFPFAFFIQSVNRNMVLSILFYPILSLFTYLNIWWTYHAHKGNIQNSDSTYAYYWRVIGRWNVNGEVEKLLENPFLFEGKIKNSEVIYFNNFNEDTSRNAIEILGDFKIKMTKELQFSENYFVSRPSNIKKWIRVSGEFNCITEEKIFWRYCQFGIKFYKNNQELSSHAVRVQRFLKGGNIVFFDAIPPIDWDKCSLFFWNADSEKEMWIDNLKVITFDD
jgi:hypothetical protein